MPEPVIVDDGGSTRIRRIKTGNVGAMDSLLDVDDLTKESKHTIKENFSNVRIVYLDQDGKSGEVVVTPFNKILISSHLNQNVLLKKIGIDLEITVYGNAGEPLVESKQHGKKRRYLVSNSGAIETVTVDGALDPVYSTGAGGGPTIPAGIKKPILYTCVVIT
jgi:hypothetical protein